MVLNGPRVDRAQLINPETRSGNVGCRPLYDNAVNARDYGNCKTKHTGLKEAEDATTRADVAVMSGLIVMDLHRPRRPRRGASQLSRVNPASTIAKSPVNNYGQRTGYYRPLPDVESAINCVIHFECLPWTLWVDGLDRPLRQPDRTKFDTDV
ncbi:uncharacterized protein An07g07350 [Aspergillus niger]|uniref:Contig An07c0210, genomic contig n=2 Tax=Aspergillus niger TaxID=5061 RepID=A2QNX5_ASPNC|nr:uncharacterized protein An07g07350 [Aspergillus niger]CAL00777.1 unnamed protein product [Aspergillus niger]